MTEFLKKLAEKTINDCTFTKNTQYFGKSGKTQVLLPSGDEKYKSFWVRDCAMMAQSGLVSDSLLKEYIKIIATHGQNREKTLFLKNGLVVPPFAVADHINYDGKAVFFPGTYSSGDDQGSGDYGFFPPFCDNYYYILLVQAYIEKSGDSAILDQVCNGISVKESIMQAFAGYNIDPVTDLCESDEEKYTVDWGFVDSVKKTGKLLFASILRHNAAKALSCLFDKDHYEQKAQKIKNSILSAFYDEKSGWFYSATGMGKQFDVWASAYAVFSGITSNQKTLKVLFESYLDKTAVSFGYVRHIPQGCDYSPESCWEHSIATFGTYQNGAWWATPVGWYAYATYLYNKNTDILSDFIEHTKKYEKEGAPFEWITKDNTEKSGLNYGTSGVLPYIGALKIEKEREGEANDKDPKGL